MRAASERACAHDGLMASLRAPIIVPPKPHYVITAGAERKREVSFFPRGKRTEESEISRREREGRERDMTKLCDTVDKLGEC